MTLEPFNRLVRLAARAFYNDITLKGDNQAKTGRGDNRGMAVVVLDALTRRQWVREEDLAKALKLHSKQLRRTLRYFEEEKLVTRDHRKETAKGAKVFSAAVAATGDAQQTTKEGEEKMKIHTHSYCCLDYAQDGWNRIQGLPYHRINSSARTKQTLHKIMYLLTNNEIYDVVRYRIHRMKKKLKDELDSRNTIQEYICPNCGRRFSAFDALQLWSPNDEYFHCENCNGELVAESDKLAAEEMGEGDDNARRRRREKLKDMLQKMEEQLKPLTLQLARVKDLTIPEFGSLQAWEARINANARLNGDNVNDISKSSPAQGYGGTPMPFLGETKVEVALAGVEAKEESTETDTKPSAMKILPPWMIKQGMNLTKEQRGEAKTEMKVYQMSQPADEKKPRTEIEDEKNIQDEYLKAYYAALVKRQEEHAAASNKMQQVEMVQGASTSYLSNGVSEAPSERQVGMKAQREDDENDDVEWEEPLAAGKALDLNVEADASPDEDEDDIDWEEG